MIHADNRAAMSEMADGSVDAVVTDPPYELGFMGRKWDATGIAYDVAMWREVLRVLKPGGHLLAFGGTRTYHRMACAIEDAGFAIRDCLQWLYGSGFPKSLDVSKAIDKAAGAERAPLIAVSVTAPATEAAKQWDGWGTALKPACEIVCMARKPLVGTVAANVEAHGTGALNVDGCRVAGTTLGGNGSRPGGFGDIGASRGSPEPRGTPHDAGRWPPNVLLDAEAAEMLDADSGDRRPMTGGGIHRNGSGAGMFGAIDSTAMHSDTGGASRYFPRFKYCAKASTAEREDGCEDMEPAQQDDTRDADAPGANNPRNRGGKQRCNTHPTVKPVELMRWLVRLITPPGGTVLDPFAGSGSTGCACAIEGFEFIGIELDARHCEIARRRIARCEREPQRPLGDAKAETADPRQVTLFGATELLCHV